MVCGNSGLQVKQLGKINPAPRMSSGAHLLAARGHLNRVFSIYLTKARNPCHNDSSIKFLLTAKDLAMPRFTITGTVTVSCYTEVDAKTPEEALKIAKERTLAGFSIDGSYLINEYFHLDNDGTPDRLVVDD
jgi:hypothetical protein